LRNIGSKLLTISADIKQTKGENPNGYSERSLHSWWCWCRNRVLSQLL